MARLAVLLLAAATLAFFCLELLIELEGQQTRQTLADAQAHVPTAPTIAAIWPTLGGELFSPERLGPIAAVPSFHGDLSAID